MSRQSPRLHRADPGGVEILDYIEDAAQISGGDTRVRTHLFGSGLEEAVVVDVADDQFRQPPVGGAKFRAIDLANEVLLKRFLVGDGIEEELTAFFIVVAAAVITAVLRHVLAPFLVELGELVELLLEIVVPRVFFGGCLGHLFFEHRVGLQLLLHDVAQFQHRGLEDHQALLQLRRQHLLHRQVLSLLHAGCCHTEVMYGCSDSVGQAKKTISPNFGTFFAASSTCYHFFMPFAPSLRRISRSPFALTICGAIFLGGWLVPTDSRSQAPAATTNNIALNAMLTKLKAQQDQMAANQTKIEAQSAQLAEQLRQAKIYAARSGSGHR